MWITLNGLFRRTSKISATGLSGQKRKRQKQTVTNVKELDKNFKILIKKKRENRFSKSVMKNHYRS